MRTHLLVLIAAASSCSPAVIRRRPPSPPPDPAISTQAGAGYYVTKIVDGETPPANDRGKPVTPKVTADFTGPPTSNDWWSSLIWQFDRGGKANPYSEVMFADPLAMQAEAAGLAIAYPTEVDVDRAGYRYRFAPDLLVGADGLAAPDARVARYSDWTVTASWSTGGDGAAALRATFGHGLPFVYVESTGGRAARVEARGKVDVWAQEGEVVALTVHGHHYALFAPGGRWKRTGAAFVAEVDHYAVAVLPDRKPATLALFRAHSGVAITGGRVEWAYHPERATVTTRFVVETRGEGTPLIALYRHQWRHTGAPLDERSYTSPRGEMKLAAAAAFDVELPVSGMMPFLPLIDESGRDALRDRVDEAWRRGSFVPPGMDGKKDAYWTGKALARLAILAELAEQSGHTRARGDFLIAIENELEDWFDGLAPFLFYYDATWRSLFALPSSYFSSTQLNDHHFHYGYFVFAAATVARLDPAWAERYRAMVELLIRDAANWDRGDERFPFLRYFDPYAGHSWANGPQLFDRGNNEESSSEDVNFAVGAVLWGTATGDAAIRDLGAFLYANLTAAIDQYWFDVDDAVFPASYQHPTIAILWGDGGRYDTWWDPSAPYVHGINFLPLTGGSLYLGRDPGYVKKNWAGLVEANRGEPLQWRDVLWMYLALGDPDGAARRWSESHDFTTEFGLSRAAVEHWIRTLHATGGLDATITADAPTAVALRNASGVTHVAYNPGAAALEVHFSDGATLSVPPRSYAHSRGVQR